MDNIKHVYCIGIGGIGVSAVARMLIHQGKKVSGSDQSKTIVTDELQKLGVRVNIGSDAKNITDDVDLVIYTIAVPANNPELIESEKRGILIKTYPQMLGIISENMKTVAISGTHGKTTTTAMITDLFIDAGLSPTAIVGSLIRKHNSNFVPGTSNIFIVEACEYRRSFLNIKPHVLVITNIDEDHLDYYKDLADIQSAFQELVESMTEKDFVICDPSDEKIIPVLKNCQAKVIDVKKINIDLKLTVPGKHNIENAIKAYAVSELFGVDKEKAVRSLNTFEGTWRRFEKKGKMENGAFVYDDYAHHPTEIKATLSAAREQFPDKKIIAVFQPHLYSRTKVLLDDFAQSFGDVDEIIIAPIYAAREDNDASISNEILARKIVGYGKKAEALHSFDDIEKYLKTHSDSESVVLTIGAGDIYKVSLSIVV